MIDSLYESETSSNDKYVTLFSNNNTTNSSNSNYNNNNINSFNKDDNYNNNTSKMSINLGVNLKDLMPYKQSKKL